MKLFKYIFVILAATLALGHGPAPGPPLPAAQMQVERGWDGRAVLTRRYEWPGSLSAPEMTGLLTLALAARSAGARFEWRDDRLQMAVGVSPRGPDPGTLGTNIQGCIFYDAQRDVTCLIVGVPTLPTIGW